MNAVKDETGRWTVRVSVKTVAGTKRKRFYAETKREVQREAEAWVAQMTRCVSELTLAEAVEGFISARRGVLSPATLRGYTSAYKTHLAGLSQPLAAFSNVDAQRFISKLASDHSPKTVRNVWALLQASVCFYDPGRTFSVHLPQRVKPDIFCPDDTLMKQVFAAVAGTELEIPVLLAATIPARRSEICALTARDIRGRQVTISKALVPGPNNELVIKAPKTRAGYRIVTIPKKVADLLPKVGPVTQLAPEVISQRFRRMLRQNGIPLFRFHALRHYGASVMLTMGIPLKEVQRRGGWESPEVLQEIYSHALLDQMPIADQMVSEHFTKIISA